MAIYIKNVSGSTGIWKGIEILDNAYYQMTNLEQTQFSNDSQTLQDIAAGNLKVATSSTGNDDISDIPTALATLISTKIASIADPFPLNEGNYSFRGTGHSSAVNSSLVNGGITNIDILIPETRYIDGADVWVIDSIYGVTVDFLVVDVDNVLGYGANFEVEQFGYTWNICPGVSNAVKPGYTARILGGLYIRAKLTNPTLTATTAYANYYLHKKA